MSSLDIEQPQALIDYLRKEGHIDPQEIPRVRLLHGGVSNRTVFVARDTGEHWVLKQALKKLRVEADWYSKPDRILREAAAMELLPRWAGRDCIPKLVFLDESAFLLAMEAVPEPHRNWKQVLLTEGPNPAHVDQFAALLARIHRESSRDKEGRERFRDRSFFQSLRLEPYYQFAGQRIPEANAFLGELVKDTLEVSDAVVHGDYSPKNILVVEDRLVLLDHEVIHWGDPAFDIGFSVTHLLSKALHVKNHRQAFHRAAHRYWESYSRELESVEWETGFENRCIRHTLGCLLARVEGRSPLEYLEGEEKRYQRQAVLECMRTRPRTMEELIDRFCNFNAISS